MKKKMYISPSVCEELIVAESDMATGSMFVHTEDNTDINVYENEGHTPGDALSRFNIFGDVEY